MRKQLYCLLMALTFPLALIGDNYVIINQVMYDTPLNEQTNISPCCNGEYIELYNAGTSSVLLDGWRITGDGNTEVYQFSNETTISAGGFLILACRRGNDNPFQISDLYTLPVNADYTILYQNKIMLANGGENITLYNTANDIIDQMHYDGTSNTSNPNRLHAENPNNYPGDSCKSLHRTSVEFDSTGKAIPGTSQWQTHNMSFAVCMLPYASYQEDYLFGEQSLPTGENFILSVTPLDPVSRIGLTNGQLSVSSGIRTMTAIHYMDGLGRQEQTITMNAAPDGQDFVSLVEYVGKRKQGKLWLPVTSHTEGQRTDVADLKSQAQSDYDDEYPYEETQYEASALRRVNKHSKPGTSYHNHEATMSYTVCDGSEQVRVYTMKNDSVLKTSGENYAPYTLYQTTDTDEDGKTMTVYTDRSGRTIAEDRGGNRTYYVYNELGRLCIVLPNISPSKLNNGEYSPDNVTLRATAYCYRYDNNGNLIYKRLPGCKPQYMVYDRLGQLVLKQDGNQRNANKWTMCAYDSLGRNLYIAEIVLEQNHEYLRNLFAGQWQVEHYGSNQQNMIAGTGYASSILGNAGIHLLTVNYYDNYNYQDMLPASVRQGLSYEQEQGYGQMYENVTGLLTATRIYALSEDSCNITAYYYDAHGRIVQSRSTTPAGTDKTAVSTAYNFDGTIIQQQIAHETPDFFVQEHYRYTYDQIGRLQKTYYQLNNEAEILLSEFLYDNKGRLAQNLLHNHRDAINYSYDMRNVLTGLNNNHFSERLFYADKLDSLPSFVHACYNGNIAATLTTHANVTDTFAYEYNPQNRLAHSLRINGNSQALSEAFSYDAAGNITLLKRYNGNRLIDSLAYSYGNDGNQLLSVTDNGHDEDRYEVVEYHNGSVQADTTMRYDANGNLIYDADRGISMIRYNILNLPDTIQFMNGNQIVNLYDATGRKYRSIAYTVLSTPLTPQYDIVPYTFESEDVTYFVIGYSRNIEHYLTPADTTIRIYNSIGYFDADSVYYHYIKDRLGNICAVVNTMADTLVQSTHYYASGVPMAQSSNRGTQPYLYNSKEFVEAHGLNTYDYGFRGYYAPIGRFKSIDPLAEQTPWQSPYAYAGNNFINNIDWMGLMGLTSMANDNSCHYIVIDTEGYMKGGVDDGDISIYMDEDGTWTEENGKDGLKRVGIMILPFEVYMAEMLLNQGKYKAPGLYDGQWTFSASLSIGAQMGFKDEVADIRIKEANLNLMAVELINISMTLTTDEKYKISYIGKNNRTKITQDVTLGPFSLAHDFLINSTTCNYIPTTENIYFTQWSSIFNKALNNNGFIEVHWSRALVIGVSVSFSGNIYYEP